MSGWFKMFLFEILFSTYQKGYPAKDFYLYLSSTVKKRFGYHVWDTSVYVLELF